LPETAAAPDRQQRFTRVYDAHYHRILGYARRRVGADDAQDVVAETFAVAWRRFDDVPEGAESLLWLYATARRVVANHHRGQRRLASLKAAIAAAPASPGATAPDEGARRLLEALARLRADERELLLLAAWEGLDNAALATVLGCSRTAARIRLHRARRRLAEALGVPDEPVKRRPAGGHVATAGGEPAHLDLEEC